jgi:hypothetical protein
MACPKAREELAANKARMRTIRFNGWPPLAGVWDCFYFSVDEVALGIPAIFEDILIVLIVLGESDGHSFEFRKFTLRSFDAHRAKRVVVIVS